MAISAELGLDLSHGFHFRPTTPRGTIVNKQVSSSAIQARLQLYLEDASLYEGETLHSFRAGAAIKLALSGAQLAEIMAHVGWRNPSTASYTARKIRFTTIVKLQIMPHLGVNMIKCGIISSLLCVSYNAKSNFSCSVTT
jgi:hypothetical protein